MLEMKSLLDFRKNLAREGMIYPEETGWPNT
jgi:hypothetical protein